jgi:protein O-GlcNAc transferase
MQPAIDAYRKELALRPYDAPAWANLALALAEAGHVGEAVTACRRALALDPANSQIHSNLLMLLHFDPASNRASIRAEHEAWAGRHAAPLAREIRPHANDRNPDRRLRIAYVSPDLRAHVVGWSILPVIEHHDRERYEVVCYSGTTAPDDVTRQLRARTDVWCDTTAMDEARLAEQIRRDGIDVLVDLSLHMGRSPLLAFARQPAPVQITYLGYAATTGLPTMDYRLTDVHMDPPGEPTDGPEELLRLSDCYWAYRPPPEVRDAAVWPPPVLRNGFATFASFNNFRKVNPGVIAAWARVLRELPEARLLIVLRGGETNTHVLDAFKHHGVARGRVRLVGRVSVDQYFRLHNEVDISLDPFPYNGGITSLNSLWMGVPFVTLVGDRAVGRAGLSILTHVGLADLAAATQDEYVQTIVSLARDRDRLAALRATLRDRLRQSPLMDEPRFTRNVERCYREAWVRWCAGGT